MTEPYTAARDTSRAAARSLADSALSHMRLALTSLRYYLNWRNSLQKIIQLSLYFCKISTESNLAIFKPEVGEYQCANKQHRCCGKPRPSPLKICPHPTLVIGGGVLYLFRASHQFTERFLHLHHALDHPRVSDDLPIGRGSGLRNLAGTGSRIPLASIIIRTNHRRMLLLSPLANPILGTARAPSNLPLKKQLPSALPAALCLAALQFP
jgi:hypothetical protein